MLARLMIVVVLLSTTGLIGCGKKLAELPTTPQAQPVTKDSKGDRTPKGMATTQAF